jgi:hypothetical protein
VAFNLGDLSTAGVSRSATRKRRENFSKVLDEVLDSLWLKPSLGSRCGENRGVLAMSACVSRWNSAFDFCKGAAAERRAAGGETAAGCA